MTNPQSHLDGFSVTTEINQFGPAPLEPPFWLISDTHFFHDNIIRYAGRPANHDALMETNWRMLIRPHSPILHLGDIAMSKRHLIEQLAPNLPGDKYLVKGNHDGRGDQFYRDLGFKIVKPFKLSYRGYTVAFSHEPVYGFTNFSRHLNVHGHIHEKEMDDRHYINASVEHTDYRPVSVTQLLDERINELNA